LPQVFTPVSSSNAEPYVQTTYQVCSSLRSPGFSHS
jgi:hypothetical protein